VGVCVVLLNAVVVARWPEHYWLLYLSQASLLFPLRFVRFRRTKEELLLLDFCYWVTAAAGIWVFVALARNYGGGAENAFTKFDRTIVRTGFTFANGALVKCTRGRVHPTILCFLFLFSVFRRSQGLCAKWPACGLQAWSIVIFQNKIVFHHVDYLTSSFVHLGPALFFYTLRWGR
jgi:hypothetical protein